MARIAVDAQLRRQLGDGGALARHGHGRIEQHFFERRILFEQVHELGQLRLDLVEVLLLLDGDIEERAGVTMAAALLVTRSTSSGRAECGSLRRLSQAAQLYTILTARTTTGQEGAGP